MARRDLAIGCALFAFLCSLFVLTPIRTTGDSQYSLLLSEQLLTRHTFALDEHFRAPLDPHRFPGINGSRGAYPYQIETVRGHQYYYFPVGSSVLSVPMMAAARVFGGSVLGADGRYEGAAEERLQGIFAGVLMAALAVVIYATSRLLLERKTSILVTIVAALGTQLWSTGSRALWSDTWGIFLLGIAVWMLLAHEREVKPLRGWVLASVVAALYIVRPTNAFTVIGVGVYVALFARAQLLSFVGAGAAWLFAFVTYAEVLFAKPLPTYYAERWLTFERFWQPLAAHLVSPSRGLFVYVPVAAFVVWLTVRYRRMLPHARLAILAYAIIAAHLVAISGFSMWYAGVAYGPRYMTGVVPWFVLLAVLGLRARPPGFSREAAVGVALAALSIVIQSRAGFSPAVWRWNAAPPVEIYPDEKIWSMRAPQLLAGYVDAGLDLPPVYTLGTLLRFDAPENDAFATSGFSGREPGRRWTDGNEAVIAFGLDRFEDALDLELIVGGFVSPKRPTQRMTLVLNGETLATIHLSQGAHRKLVLPVRPGQLLKRNRLVIQLPDADSPANAGAGTDTRRLGAAFASMRIRPSAPLE